MTTTAKKAELLAELHQHSVSPYAKETKVEMWLNDISESDPELHEALIEAFEDMTISATAIYKLMRRSGFDGSYTGVRRYREDSLV